MGFSVVTQKANGKKKADTVFELAKKQRKLIDKALELLKPGGELIFSVCSFELQESVDHLTYLKEEKNIKVIDISKRLPPYYSKYITKDQVLMIYPGNKENMDGFSSFAIKKIG